MFLFKVGKLEKMMSFSAMSGKVQLESLEIVQQKRTIALPSLVYTVAVLNKN